MANPEMGPQEPEEEIPREDIEEIEEEPPEMTPEDFQETLSQTPAFKEMLAEREKRLEKSTNPEEIKILQTEIAELSEQIAHREYFLE